MLKQQKDFDAKGFVSVWLGNFPVEVGEGGLDDYFPQEFEQDSGFEVEAPDGPEYEISEDGPKPIRSLIDGCYLSDRYLDDVVSLCHSQGWLEATTVLMFLNVRYQPDGLEVNPDAQAKFMGAVAMHKP